MGWGWEGVLGGWEVGDVPLIVVMRMGSEVGAGLRRDVSCMCGVDYDFEYSRSQWPSRLPKS